jgi:enamine deaminase RidA (YjgF/YER057c/UK114 family)
VTTPIYHLIPNAPKPVAPYSHVVEADGWLFVTGQLATDPDDDSLPLPEGIEAQTRKVMDNLKRALADVGAGYEHVVCVRIFLTNSSAITLGSTASTLNISNPTGCLHGPRSGSRIWRAAVSSRLT